MVSAAAVWESVPFSTSYASPKMEVKLEIQARGIVKEKEKDNMREKIEHKDKVGAKEDKKSKRRTQNEDERDGREKGGVVERIMKARKDNRKRGVSKNSSDGEEQVKVGVRDREIYKDSRGVREGATDVKDKVKVESAAQIKDERKGSDEKDAGQGVWAAVATHTVEENTLQGYALVTLEFVQVRFLYQSATVLLFCMAFDSC